MSELRELQQCFLDYLLKRPSNVAEYIESTPSMSATDRLGLYATAYILRLKEAISTDYSKLHEYLGNEQFHKVMERYIEKYPSHNTNLRYYSVNMANLLSEEAPFNQLPALHELASIESAFANSFDAEDNDFVTMDDVATLAPEVWPALQLEFQKSVQLLSTEYNSFAIWKALSNDTTPPELEQLAKPVSWVIWRRSDLISHYRTLSLAEMEMLNMAIKGESFAVLCEKLLDFFTEDETPIKAITFLQSWIQDEMLSRLRYK